MGQEGGRILDKGGRILDEGGSPKEQVIIAVQRQERSASREKGIRVTVVEI